MSPQHFFKAYSCCPYGIGRSFTPVQKDINYLDPPDDTLQQALFVLYQEAPQVPHCTQSAQPITYSIKQQSCK
jgi:hypothetical protein